MYKSPQFNYNHKLIHLRIYLQISKSSLKQQRCIYHQTSTNIWYHMITPFQNPTISIKMSLVSNLRLMVVQQKIKIEQLDRSFDQIYQMRQVLKEQKDDLTRMEKLIDELVMENNELKDRILEQDKYPEINYSSAQVPKVRNMHDTVCKETPVLAFNWQGSTEMSMNDGEFNIKFNGKAVVAYGSVSDISDKDHFDLSLTGEMDLRNGTERKAIVWMSMKSTNGNHVDRNIKSISEAAGFNCKLTFTSQKSVSIRAMKLDFKPNSQMKSLAAVLQGTLRYDGQSIVMNLSSC